MFPHLINVVKGGIPGKVKQGTWMHEDVALEFARWLSPAFAIWCNDKIKELMRKGSVSIKPEINVNFGGFPIPAKFSDALILAAHLQQTVEVQEAKIAEDQPKVEYYSNMVENRDYFTTTTIATELRTTAQILNQYLSKRGVLKGCAGVWTVTDEHQTLLVPSPFKSIIRWNHEGRILICQLWEEREKRLQLKLKKTKMNNVQGIYNKIVVANKEYRNGTPIMSDLEYDTWIDKLREIDPDNDWFKHIEPGMEVSESRKVKLPFPMRSLDKAKTIKEVLDWAKKIGLSENENLSVTPKYDGISLLCNERNQMSFSRGGNDNEGMNCQDHMKAMRNVFHNWDNFSYTFGEAIISRESWMKHFEGRVNPQTGILNKSPRNTVSGLFRRDTPSGLLRFVDFVRYGWFDDCGYSSYYKTTLQMEYDFGYATKVWDMNLNDISEEYFRDIFHEARRKYCIDGLVIYVDDISKWDSIGRHSSTGNPQWAIAYKPEEFTSAEVTTVKDVNCKVAKSGYLKPTIAVDAVELEGATIDNPTGYNAKFCFDKGIGKGAEIKIIRSGMVIPKVIGVTFPVPNKVVEEAFKYCPACGKETIWNNSLVERMCPDSNCPGRLLAKLVCFCDKMEYDDIGEEILKSIYYSGIETPGALLHADLSDLQRIDGIGYDTASKIIEKNRSIFDDGVSLPKLMEVSDCFEGIGEKKATLLLSNIDNETLCLWTNRELNTTGLLVIVNILNNTKGVGKKMIDEFLSHERKFVNWINENQIPIDWNEKETEDFSR